jgi:hypothetical protein
MVVELSEVQVEDVENPHSEPTTASTTNSTFNYVRDIAIPTLFTVQRSSSVMLSGDSSGCGKIDMIAWPDQ